MTPCNARMQIAIDMIPSGRRPEAFLSCKISVPACQVCTLAGGPTLRMVPPSLFKTGGWTLTEDKDTATFINDQ
jgi:hypothetical protein